MLLVESQAGVVRLTLNRPERRNALSEAMLTELGAALERIAADRSARVVVLGAAGAGLLCGTRFGRNGGPAQGRLSDALRAVFAGHAADSATSPAGHRPRAGAGHGRRMPTGGDLRSGRGGQRGEVRHARREDRAVLHDPHGAAGARGAAQGGRWKCC